MTEPLTSEPISTQLHRIATRAREMPGVALRTLAQCIDIAFLREAYRRIRKDGAVGVDRQTAEDYAANLEANLQHLLDRAKSGTYRAPPVRRVHIPKGDGAERRPIGIPTFEAKILQRAVTRVLEAGYEAECLDCSYGFRPTRSAHQALQVLRDGVMAMRGGWVLEVDIRKCFDTLDHRQLRAILRTRVQDGVLLRLLGKWLHAGVLENGAVTSPDAGTPQGGVLSPLLANVFLHEVLDTWFEREVRPRLKGRAVLVRYADDVTMVFAREADAHRGWAVLPKRLARYGLTLHTEKTRLITCHPPSAKPEGDRRGPSASPPSFDMLGFTPFWGRSRQGYWVVKRKTAGARLSRALRVIARWCRPHRHAPLVWQHAALCRKLHGHDGYYGITGNSVAITRFRWEVRRRWQKWLNRRGARPSMPWPRFDRLEQRYPLPAALAIHSVLRPAANP